MLMNGKAMVGQNKIFKMRPFRKDKKKCHKNTKTLRFHKGLIIFTLHLVKPLSLCVFVAEQGFSEWTQKSLKYISLITKFITFRPQNEI